jgi:hypothetical protein
VDSVPSGEPICSLAFDPSLAPQHDGVPMHIGQFVLSWTANLSFSRDEQIHSWLLCITQAHYTQFHRLINNSQGKPSFLLIAQLDFIEIWVSSSADEAVKDWFVTEHFVGTLEGEPELSEVTVRQRPLMSDQ